MFVLGDEKCARTTVNLFLNKKSEKMKKIAPRFFNTQFCLCDSWDGVGLKISHTLLFRGNHNIQASGPNLDPIKALDWSTGASCYTLVNWNTGILYDCHIKHCHPEYSVQVTGKQTETLWTETLHWILFNIQSKHPLHVKCDVPKMELQHWICIRWKDDAV